jgi:hypothetical protein
MNKQTSNIITIIILMILTGLILYHMFYRIEKFTDPQTTPAVTAAPTAAPSTTIANVEMKSLVSVPFGIGFNINKITSGGTTKYMLEHLPVTKNETVGGYYAINSDGMLTTKLQDETDSTQWWNFIEKTDTDNNTKFLIVQPYNDSTKGLMYANGNLYLRPMTSGWSAKSQRWVLSPNPVSRGLEVLNSQPYSSYSSEYVPYTGSTSSNFSDKQYKDIMDAIKAGFEQYNKEIATKTVGGQVTSSPFGSKNLPLKLTLDLSGVSQQGFKNIDKFANTDSLDDDQLLAFLDEYDNAGNKTFYNQTDLQQALNKAGGCKNVDLNKYINRRVGQCNCAL